MVVFDRLLSRLLVVAPDRWIVKGGFALDLRLGHRARVTQDLDLARQDTEEAATADFAAATEVDLGDFFVFAIERTSVLDAVGEGVAVRYRVQANLDGRRFEYVRLDIGLGVPLPETPDQLTGPDLLAFAGIAPIEVPALPLEDHVAEKVHAYTRTRGDGRENTRVKDLIDLMLIPSAAAFEAGRLRQALRITFETRAIQVCPDVLPPPPAAWAIPYRKLATEVALDPDLATGHRLAAAFLDGVLNGSLADAARWDPATGAWSSPGG